MICFIKRTFYSNFYAIQGIDSIFFNLSSVPSTYALSLRSLSAGRMMKFRIWDLKKGSRRPPPAGSLYHFTLFSYKTVMKNGPQTGPSSSRCLVLIHWE
jgi:hypothetical protein